MNGKNLYYHILDQGYTQEELDRVLHILTTAGAESVKKSLPSVRSSDLTINKNPLEITPGNSPVINQVI